MVDLKKKIAPDNEKNSNIENKIFCALIKHVYSQTFIALIASLFCASMVFIALYGSLKDTSALLIWSVFFLTITILRIGTVIQFYTSSHTLKFMKKAKNTYT